jgi:myo-inositol-1(or 4)-monophosphatase
MMPEEKLDLSARLAVATEVTRSVGREASAFRESSGSAALQIEDKGPQDFVTVADKRAEASIRAAVTANFPNDGFMGEEGGGERSGQALWVVDPIDGTTNFIRGFRHWGVSIAVVADNKIQIGVVYDAAVDKVYSAVRGSGAFKDGQRIKSSTLTDPLKGLAILGHSRRTDFNEYQRLGRELYDLGIDCRRMGAAAIDLVRVADGVADLYYEQHLFGWDMLAGALIAHEAGAQVLIPALDQALTEGGAVIAVAAGLISRIGFLREAAGPLCSV